MSYSMSDFPRHLPLWRAVETHLPPGELAHDRLHIGRVYGWALQLADEAEASPDLCGAAALVHDLVPIPKNHPDRAKAGERSAAASGPILDAVGYSSEEAGVIMEAVRTSSWSRGLEPTHPVGVVLQDADRLDAIGAIGVARTVACAQYMSSAEAPGRFYEPNDPLYGAERALDDKRQSADHFYRKLLRLEAGMHLPSAKQEARRRHLAMVAWLGELGADLRHAVVLP